MSAASEPTPGVGPVEPTDQSGNRLPTSIHEAVVWLEDNTRYLVVEDSALQILLVAASPIFASLIWPGEGERAHIEAKAYVDQQLGQAALHAPPGADPERLSKMALLYLSERAPVKP